MQAVLTAPAASTTRSPVQRSSPWAVSQTTSVTVRPASSVSSFITLRPVSRVTLGRPSRGSMARVRASDLAFTRQG